MQYLTCIVSQVIMFVALSLGQSQANEDLQRYERFANQLKIEDANFELSRHISVLSKPLSSTGRVYINTAGELVWHQTAPYEVILRFGETTIEETLPGMPSRPISIDDNVYMSMMSRAFFGLFSGRPGLLLTLFDVHEDSRNIEGENVSGPWTAIFVPKDALLGKAIGRLIVEGNSSIEHIQIFEVSGDHTDIGLTPRDPD